MSVSYCIKHKKKHDSPKWRYTTGWFCVDKVNRYEWIPDSVKDSRKVNAKDIIQPWREGQASKEFIEAYPQQADKFFSKEEKKGAKEVWR